MLYFSFIAYVFSQMVWTSLKEKCDPAVLNHAYSTECT